MCLKQYGGKGEILNMAITNGGYYPQQNFDPLLYQQQMQQLQWQQKLQSLEAQQQPQQQQTNQPQFSLINSTQEASSYVVSPNSNAILLDIQDDLLYIKQADGIGKISTRVFKLEEVEYQQAPKEIDASLFVTQAEFNSLKSQISDFISSLGGMSKPVEEEKEKISNKGKGAK